VKRLSLKIERLSELSQEELRAAVAGAVETYTGTPGCVVSFQPPCVTSLCTVLYPRCIQTS
jgi:hypothetical protein